MTGGTLALFARNGPGVLYADLAACAAWTSGPDAARRVTCPALVVIAANDIMTDRAPGTLVREAAANHSYLWDAGATPPASALRPVVASLPSGYN